MQLFGSDSITASTTPSVQAVPALIATEYATVTRYQPDSCVAFCWVVPGCDCICACCGPIFTPPESGSASRA